MKGMCHLKISGEAHVTRPKRVISSRAYPSLLYILQANASGRVVQLTFVLGSNFHYWRISLSEPHIDAASTKRGRCHIDGVHGKLDTGFKGPLSAYPVLHKPKAETNKSG